MTIKAEIAYGSAWKVEASGWSWKAGKADEVRIAAQVMQLAPAIMTLLGSVA